MDRLSLLELKLNSPIISKDISENILPAVYIDEYLNLVSSQEDFYYFSSYKEQLNLFKQMFSNRLHNTVCKIRAER